MREPSLIASAAAGRAPSSECCESLAEGLSSPLAGTAVARRPGLSRECFLAEYGTPKQPVILPDLTADWGAQRWSTTYLSLVAGTRQVPVYDSSPARERKHQHAAAETLPLSDYLERLEGGEKDLRMFFYHLLKHAPEITDDIAWPDVGLKLFRKLPVLFIGGRDARVQMHFDIDLADNLLCHFGGRKRVLLFPPEQTRFMYRVPYSFSSLFAVDFERPDFNRYPGLARLDGEIATLEHGDVLYIPSGWWHYVMYDDIGYSVSLRAFPRGARDRAAILRNLFVLRHVDALMRRVVGQRWNERNERLAVSRVEDALAV